MRDLVHEAAQEGDKCSDQRIILYDSAATSQEPIKCIDERFLFCPFSKIIDSDASKEDNARFLSWYKSNMISRKVWGPASDAYMIKPPFDFKVDTVDSKHWFQTLWTSKCWLTDSVRFFLLFFLILHMIFFYFVTKLIIFFVFCFDSMLM